MLKKSLNLDTYNLQEFILNLKHDNKSTFI